MDFSDTPVSADAVAMTPQMRVLSRLRQSTGLQQSGDSSAAIAELEAALADVRATPYEVEFQTRVQLVGALADLYLETAAIEQARTLLAEESTFAEGVFQIIQVSGTKEQRRDSAGGRVFLRDRLQQAMIIKTEAPEIRVKEWISGEPATLASLRGRVVLLEFWATWCKPCREMFAKLKQLDEIYRPRGLEIIALTRHYFADRHTGESQADELNLMRRTVAEQDLTFRVGVAEDERTQELYGATGLPTLALIDRTSIVRDMHFGGGEDARLEELLNRYLDV